MTSREFDIIDSLYDESGLPERVLDHLEKKINGLKLYSYDISFISNGRPGDGEYLLEPSPSIVAGRVCRMVVPLLLDEDTSPVSMLSIYRAIHTQESVWQDENQAQLFQSWNDNLWALHADDMNDRRRCDG